MALNFLQSLFRFVTASSENLKERLNTRVEDENIEIEQSTSRRLTFRKKKEHFAPMIMCWCCWNRFFNYRTWTFAHCDLLKKERGHMQLRPPLNVVPSDPVSSMSCLAGFPPVPKAVHTNQVRTESLLPALNSNNLSNKDTLPFPITRCLANTLHSGRINHLRFKHNLLKKG